MTPLLSVMMPVYNGAAYLREAVASVLQQEFKNFEFLIMDDGSTDESPLILKRYAEMDPRVRLFLRQHQGQIACRNELLRLAKADIVACADADDVCLPSRFEWQFHIMSRDSDLAVLGTAMTSIDMRGRRRKCLRVVTESGVVAAELKRRCCIGHPSCMMRRTFVIDVGGYRPAYEAAEDYDLFLRASERGKVDNLGVVGVLYRQHDGSESHRNSMRQAISADLARATHLLRVRGDRDPTEDLLHPPQLESPLLAALIPPEQIMFHRAIATTYEPSASPAEVEEALRYFLHAPVGKKQERAFQRAMVGLIGRRGLDRLSLAVAARATVLGPGRFVRLLWK
jgi:glycosyltransferase involved in cell wall biosynthesis